MSISNSNVELFEVTIVDNEKIIFKLHRLGFITCLCGEVTQNHECVLINDVKELKIKFELCSESSCRRTDHEFTCECEYCFLFDNSKLILINSHMLADCFLANICDIETIFSYRSACPKIYYKSSLKNLQNIDKWAPDDSGVILDYLKLYSVFNSLLR